MYSKKKTIHLENSSEKLNLNTEKLDVKELMKYDIYQRLYNIICKDRTPASDKFRKNLIRELYFLMQMAPFICEELRLDFLKKIETWYNNNDRKKIRLSENIQKKIYKKRTKFSNEQSNKRPKTTDILSRAKPEGRPQTCKFGYFHENNQQKKSKDQASTCLRTLTEQCDSQNNERQSFLMFEDSKHRTLHPEEIPAYEKLYNLIKESSHPEASLQSRKFIKRTESIQKKEKLQSSRTSNFNIKETREYVEDDFGEQNEEDQEQSIRNEEENGILMQKKGVKPFILDTLRTKNFITHKKTDEDEIRLSKIKLLKENKIVRRLREDQEFLKEKLQYAKIKSFRSKERMRKIESKKVFKSKVNQRMETEPAPFQKENNPKLIQLNEDFHQKKDEYPFYQEKQFFAVKNKEELKKNMRNLNQLPAEISSSQKKLNLSKKVTNYVRFNSEVKFNPAHEINLSNYNQDSISDIEKVKQLTAGKNYIQVQTLRKALCVDIPEEEKDKDWTTMDRNYLLTKLEDKKQKKVRKNRRKKTIRI